MILETCITSAAFCAFKGAQYFKEVREADKSNKHIHELMGVSTCLEVFVSNSGDIFSKWESVYTKVVCPGSLAYSRYRLDLENTPMEPTFLNKEKDVERFIKTYSQQVPPGAFPIVLPMKAMTYTVPEGSSLWVCESAKRITDCRKAASMHQAVEKVFGGSKIYVATLAAYTFVVSSFIVAISWNDWDGPKNKLKRWFGLNR